jgi:hypothetical protein
MTEQTTTERLAELEPRLTAELDWLTEFLGLNGEPVDSIDVETHAVGIRAVRDLAEAVNFVTAARARLFALEQHATAAAGSIDVEALAAAVWAATQEAGGTTDVGDAAVAVVRKAFAP